MFSFSPIDATIQNLGVSPNQNYYYFCHSSIGWLSFASVAAPQSKNKSQMPSLVVFIRLL
ncbi:hypothetical protein SGRA_0729 [Saprospira grandis str. Lewin]|uniref:Uncharacterized protein n=1 Tax=Saprospira grandis (strain Lewin) TaxID=984262 RepID=H6L1C7_SAPGL|nr:hypothetical protein SGRA_0729 [Saprospira grandis str. Lewin]